jgi:NAD(P)-dependent dehydrogenase (short-subunit alcohol dehydrogenase family)
VPTAVITGGWSGIGGALARALAARGWHCVLLARARERLERVAIEIGADWEVCDITDRGQVDRVAAAIGKREPEIQLLVNNAGIPGRTGFVDSDLERIEQVMATNYFGGLWCLRAFLPFLEAGAPSHVVNVVSTAGLVSYGSGPTPRRSMRNSPSRGPSGRSSTGSASLC